MDSLFAYLCDMGLVDDLENLVVDTGMVDESAWLIQCAWCLQEQGLPLGPGSHGICPFHRDQLMQDRRSKQESQSHSNGGLELGTVQTSALFLLTILATVIYLTITKKDAPALTDSSMAKQGKRDELVTSSHRS